MTTFKLIPSILVLLGAAVASAEASPTYAHTQSFWAVSGTLNGAVLPGFPSLAWFEWGSTTEYGQMTAPVPVGASTKVVPVQAVLANLAAGQVYHARLVVSNATGFTVGADRQFITFDHQVTESSNRKVAMWFNGGTFGCGCEGRDYTGWERGSPPLTNVVSIAPGPGIALGTVLRDDGTAIQTAAWECAWERFWLVPRGFTNLVEITANMGLRIDGTLVSENEGIPSGSTNIVAISSGLYGRNNLALRDDGTVIAWSSDNADIVAKPPPGLGELVQISAGYLHSLALRKNGTVVAWGQNESGQTNVPQGLSNVVAIAAGYAHSLALRADGTVVPWGLNGQINVPVGLSNIVAVAAGETSLALRSDGTVVHWSPIGLPVNLSNVVAICDGYRYSAALGANTVPTAFHSAWAGAENSDLLVQLLAWDPNPYDSLQFRILTLPPAGTLYQVENETRGVAITAPNTPVTDPNHQVFFVPPPDAVGNPYTSFTFAVNDGEVDSKGATATISLIEPFPKLTIGMDPWDPSSPVLRFSGATTNTYRVYVSTNLLDWRALGPVSQTTPGLFEFRDPVTNDPARFYKVSTP